MKRFRKFIFWCHLTAGVISGLVILIMSVTGALLAFQPQIERFADRDARTMQPPQSEAQRLSTQALFAKVREARPDPEANRSHAFSLSDCGGFFRAGA